MRALVEVGLSNAAAAAVLALLAASISRLCRRPAVTHTLWLLVLLKLVTPPIVPLSLPWPAEEGPVPMAEAVAPAEEPAPLEPAPPPAGVTDVADLPSPDPAPAASTALDWWIWVAAVWLGGSALWAAWVAVHVVRFRRLLRFARPAPGGLRAQVEELARLLGLRRCPDVWLVDGAVSPMVWALGCRPCLLFPSGLLDRLGDEGRAALLAHELAHVRRRDHWVRLLELAATGLYWWHPALWWARRELHEAEEQCCDAWGVWALGGDGRPYALALLQAAAFVSQVRLPLPAGASGVGPVSHLKRRLEMVMQGKTSRSLSLAGLVVVLALGLLLPLFPAFGQQPTPPSPAVEKQDSRDQHIADLRRALQILEEQKREEAFQTYQRAVRAGAAPAAAEPAPVRALSATDELKVVEQAIAEKRRDLLNLEKKAQDLRAKIGEGAGRTPAAAGPANRTRGAGEERRAPEDLEKRLDRLQKELEELRRELRPRNAPADGTPAPRRGNFGGATPAPEAPGTSRPTPPAATDPAAPPAGTAAPARSAPPVPGVGPDIRPGGR